MSYLKISNKIIEWGIIFLIVFTPIAFGTVHPWAYTLMELTICFLIIIWIIRLALINIKKTSTNKYRASSIEHRASGIENRESSLIIPESLNPSIPKSSLVNRFGFIKTPLNIPIILFIGLILFQLVPLPPGVLKLISPNTYQLYQTTSPGWPDGVPFYEPNQQLARMDTNPAKSLEQIDRAGGSSITNLTETAEALAIQSDRGVGHQSPMTTDKRPMTRDK